MELLSKRRSIEETHFERVFAPLDGKGSFFAFDCDASGNILFGKLQPVATHNARRCLAGELVHLRDKGILTWVSRHTIPAVGICDCCGREVVLQGFTNACRCGRDYNRAGQLLAPRCQWGEETGESLAEILAVE